MSTSINFDTENFGKLFIRIFLGIYFVVIGVHFFVSGHDALIVLGTILKILGITFSPIFFGWVLASMHIICGMTILIGFLFRISCFLLGSVTLLEAIIALYTDKNFINGVAHIFLLSMILFGMMFVGGGRFSAKN